MKQLSGLDAAFLHLETEAQFGHVSALTVFSRPPEDPTYEPYTAWREQLRRRLPLLAPLRRRLVEVPLGLDHPFWLEDPDFDLDFHVRHAAVPPPGGEAQLAAVVARMIGRALDRARPLWLSYVIEGLADERFAILTIFHHAAVDGVLGAEVMGLMLDRHPDGGPDPVGDDWRPEAQPGGLQMLSRGTLGLARKPARAVLLAARTAEELGRATRTPALARAARQVRAGLGGPVGAVLNAGRSRPAERDEAVPLPSVRPPRAPFNERITPHRRVAIGTASLDDVKAIKNAHGATVNDVVIAVCAAGLRAWLERHDALPSEPLVAMIPISTRTGNEQDPWQNRVSMLTASLPTDEPDPAQRLRTVHRVMQQSKELWGALPAERLTDAVEFSPPAVFARAMRLSARLGLGSRTAPGNLVISNIPGPREPLFAAGAALEHYYPLSMILEGQGLNITVQSYLDRLDFGLVCCPELVPDVDELLEAILGEITSLAAACP
ncbi:MAG TPA: wax ester/triacylglycerol synthase family O-acyltransferase [Solirubrobacteraceae bacterium]|jgi:WS/DGAT/MGAT family acyltransferase|nr:wax ester/triacylglycerol synthase family O-acyltransferase [Solirubrobacteraceae bacterium]